MLAAVAQLDDTSIAEARVLAPGSLKPQPLVASTSSPTPGAAGECRHVTVMFCDLVDSTGIAAQLDAEEWRDLVGAYRKQLIVQTISNPTIAACGHPAAHEAKEFSLKGKSFVSDNPLQRSRRVSWR